jgi:hypothetical protein
MNNKNTKNTVSKKRKALKNFKLPNKLIVIPNKDKQFHERWSKGRSLCNIPHPFRCIISAPPNSGKTNIIKNLCLHQVPVFDKVYLIHCDGAFTKEYDDLQPETLDAIPDPKAWTGDHKALVILEDLSYKDLGKHQQECLKRLWGFVSTHKNISTIMTLQTFHEVPPIIRRCSNLFILYPSLDSSDVKTISRKVGLNVDKLQSLFKTFCKNQYDSIWIDLQDKSPSKLRLNCFKKIKCCAAQPNKK